MVGWSGPAGPAVPPWASIATTACAAGTFHRLHNPQDGRSGGGGRARGGPSPGPPPPLAAQPQILNRPDTVARAAIGRHHKGDSRGQRRAGQAVLSQWQPRRHRQAMTRLFSSAFVASKGCLPPAGFHSCHTPSPPPLDVCRARGLACAPPGALVMGPPPCGSRAPTARGRGGGAGPLSKTRLRQCLFLHPLRGGAAGRPPGPHRRRRAVGGRPAHFRGGGPGFRAANPCLTRCRRPPGHASWGVHVCDRNTPDINAAWSRRPHRSRPTASPWCTVASAPLPLPTTPRRVAGLCLRANIPCVPSPRSLALPFSPPSVTSVRGSPSLLRPSPSPLFFGFVARPRRSRGCCIRCGTVTPCGTLPWRGRR